ncbi:flagellar hook-basal body complex protein FliE [Myxococcota bacterium]|nr:flagellar hook-basal body complex protein FliE [Myxococcota bacterium]
MSTPLLEILPIEAVPRSTELSGVEANNATKTEFSDWLSQQVQGLDAQLDRADASLEAFAVGETSNIHHVMLAIEEARLSFDLAVQVRNRVLEAYQEIMRMQI